MLKFSRARAAVLGVVSTAVPRCTAQASSTCAGVFLTRAAIAKMTGSSSGPGLTRDPMVQKPKTQFPFARKTPEAPFPEDTDALRLGPLLA